MNLFSLSLIYSYNKYRVKKIIPSSNSLENKNALSKII